MTIAPGDRLPDATFRTKTADGTKTLSTADVFANKTVVLFGVPGAFTPTCTNDHAAGYIAKREELAAHGADTVAVVAVNDHHVLAAWETFTGGAGKLLYLADGNGTFVSALGLQMDMSAGGMGVRSKRFSLIARDGVVRVVNAEDTPATAEASGVERVLTQL